MCDVRTIKATAMYDYLPRKILGVTLVCDLKTIEATAMQAYSLAKIWEGYSLC